MNSLTMPPRRPVGDVVFEEPAPGGLLGRGEEAVTAAHLVDHDGQLAALVGEAVHLGALRHHDGVADAGHPVGEMTQRVLLDQIGDDLGPEGVDVGAHRCVMDEIGGAFVEHPGRFAALVAQDLPAARIGRLEVDSGDRHRCRVGVRGVVGVVHHADRIVRRDIIEFIAGRANRRWHAGRHSRVPRPTDRRAWPRRRRRAHRARPACPRAAGRGSRRKRGSKVVIEKWLCGSQKPGISARPRRSTCVASGLTACRTSSLSPTAMILPSRTATPEAIRSSPSIVNTRPPLNSSSMLGTSPVGAGDLVRCPAFEHYDGLHVPVDRGCGTRRDA